VLSQLPRFLSFPKQIYVEHELALKNLLEVANGSRPCYITPYVFHTRETCTVDCLITDFDGQSIMTLPKPYADTLKVKHFCEEYGLDYVLDFSGGKGYHILPGVKNEEIKNEETKVIVKSKIANVQLSLQAYLGLQTLDPKVIGDHRRVLRIPTTVYVNKMGVRNGLYCRNILPEDFEKGIHHILQLAREPGIVPKKPKQNMTLEQILECIPEKFRVYRKYNQHEYPKVTGGEVRVPKLEEIHCPCMIKALKQIKPLHDVRLEVTCWLKLCGYKIDTINHFYHRINWRDFDWDKTEANVRSINARPPDCGYMSRLFGDEGCSKCSLNKLR